MDFPEEEEENSNIQSFPKEQENENYPLKKMEIIGNINDKNEKNLLIPIKKNYLKIIYIIFVLTIFFLLFNYLIKNMNDSVNNTALLPDSKPHKKSNLKINIINKGLNQANHNKTNINTSNDNKTSTSINTTKINIGFVYSVLSGNGISRFLIVTGEYLQKTGKYNVYFFTKNKTNKELSYNNTIKRIYAYNNNSLIKKYCKSEKINIVILNNVFSPGTIKLYKSLGIKTIGIYHGVYMSPMFNNDTLFYRHWQYLEHFDAFIHISSDDYYYFKNFNFKRNIFIPNLYTFEPSKTPSSNLTTNNIIMLGRLSDKKKGLIYAIKAIKLIKKEIPDVKLNLISSDPMSFKFKNIIKGYNLTNNIFYIPFTPNISDYFLNTSIFFFPSLTEAFPMALNEAKAYGLPCVTFDVSYSLPYQSGVIKVDTFDYESFAKETIKLLKDYNYRIKMGKEAKLSLNRFNNENTTNLWGRLFNALINGEDEFQKLRKEIENKYYNKEIAEKHMEKQFEYIQRYNKFFRCHSLKNFTDINYINKIDICKNIVGNDIYSNEF